jgi:hypothetical protein
MLKQESRAELSLACISLLTFDQSTDLCKLMIVVLGSVNFEIVVTHHFVAIAK